MACRVGMSTTPYTRMQYWKEEEGYTDGEILHSNLTYDEATKLEREEAQSRGCKYGEGGERKEGNVWSVYHVWK